MNFRVRWTKTARDQLTVVWLAHHDRNSVTAAAHRVEQLLRHDSANVGEDRPNGRRVIFDTPLVVLFRVDDAARVVTVTAVSRYGAA